MVLLALNGTIYERELKSIFSGEDDRLKNSSWITPELKGRIQTKPFMVVRAAGSHGFDIIIIRQDISIPIEIKSSRERILNFSSSSNRSQIQAEAYIKLIAKTGVLPLYAFRLKNVSGDPWKVFTINSEYQGKYRQLSKIIPPIDVTKRGAFTMKWDRGLPLTSLLEYLF